MATLEKLPSELLVLIASHLPTNYDIKQLRLASPTLGRNALLRITRVFIGANPLNVKVFRETADSEIYRHRIVEIIWDDAHLRQPCSAPAFEHLCPDHRKRATASHYYEWFQSRCSKITTDSLTDYREFWEDAPHIVAIRQQVEAQPPMLEMWKTYVGLLSEQQKIMNTSDDANALEYGLQRFTSLEKITLTPATHGTPFTPYYKTPMIRSFPYGFNYPIPRGWLSSESYGHLTPPKWSNESERNRWRGHRIITWMLANREHNVKELVTDVALLNTGLNSHMFDEPCSDTNDLRTLLKTPGFRRLDLALIVGNEQFHSGFPCFRSQTLRSAFEEARELEHFSLRTNIEYEDSAEDWGRAGDDGFVPLKTVFPIENWPKLRHFGLSSFIVRLEDLMDFLASLPDSIQEVELSFLHFQEGYGSHMELLEAIKHRLDWRRRPKDQRPRLKMARHHLGASSADGEAIWLDEEVNDFVYGKGDNPYPERTPMGIYVGDGYVRNIFQPARDHPNWDIVALMKAGYRKPAKCVWPQAFDAAGDFVPPEGWKRAVPKCDSA